MRLLCPRCGDRPLAEYDCGGTTAIARPERSCSDAEWTEYLFFRRNPKGAHAERWRHTFGCGLWFNAVRDTATHAVAAVYPITEAAPGEAPLQTSL